MTGSAPAPKAAPAAPVKDEAATKAATDSARAAEKALARRRGGRQSLILTPSSTGEATGAGGRATSLLGGGTYPAP
jgi:hypothetical protein